MPTVDQSDHDILIELRVLLGEMRRDMSDMKDGTNKTLADHETRMRALEAQTNSWIGKQSVIGAIIGIIAGLAGSFIQAGKI